MRVLLAINDGYFGNLLELHLQDVNIEVTRVNYGEEALDLLFSQPFDCFILERDLKDQNGVQMLLDIPQDFETPILFVVNSTLTRTEHNMATMHADAVIIRPFKAAKFIEMVMALADDIEEPDTWVFYDALSVDTVTHKLFFDRKPLRLPKIEGDILEYLMLHSEKTVSNDVLRSELFSEWDPPPSNDMIDAIVLSLGNKLHSITGFRYVHSIPERGQRIWNPPWMRSIIHPKNPAQRRQL